MRMAKSAAIFLVVQGASSLLNNPLAQIRLPTVKLPSVQLPPVPTIPVPSPAKVASQTFQGIPIASAAMVALATISHDVAVAMGPLVAASTLETAFQLVRRAQHFQHQAPPPTPRPAGNLSFSEFWIRVLDATEDIEDWVEDFFWNVESVHELSKLDIEEWIGRNTYGRPLNDLADDDRTEVETMRRALEDRLGFEFHNNGKRSNVEKTDGILRFLNSNNEPEFIAPPAEPVLAKQHPLVLYALLSVRRSRYRVQLQKLGFERKPAEKRSFASWIRKGDSEKAPIVFAHGIGMGLFPYSNFIDELVASVEPSRSLVLLEVPSISTSLAAPDLASGEILAADLRAALDDEGGSHPGCVIVAHSFGSILASFLTRYEPEVVRSVVLVEPACFLLNLAKSTKRVLYQDRDDDKSSWDPILDLVAKDPGNAYALRRCFWWHQAMLLADDLIPCIDAPSTVFLSDQDRIVPSDQIHRYLEPYLGDLPLTIQRFPEGHGRWQFNPDHINRVVAAALDGAKGVDAREDTRSQTTLTPLKRRRALDASISRFRTAIAATPARTKKLFDDLLKVPERSRRRRRGTTSTK